MKSPVPTSYYPRFFVTIRKAYTALGLDSKSDQDAYYKLVLKEEANCSSIRELPSLAAFDACLVRFSNDAQDYTHAVDPEVEKQKRRAYVVKVMSIQIMQLKGFSGQSDVPTALAARAYIEGILKQSRCGASFHSDGSNYWMDLSAGSILLVLRILDSHLRKLKRKHFPTFPLSFDDRIKFVFVHNDSGFTILRENVDKWHYANLPFEVRFSS